MAGAFHEVGAAVPGLGTAVVRLVGTFVEEGQVPEPHADTPAERPRQLVFAIGRVDRLDVLEVCPQRRDVGIAEVGIGGVGHRRVQTNAALGDALFECASELGFVPVADAVFRIRRDVRRIQAAEGRGEFHAAGIGFAAALGGMTGHAIGRTGDIGAVLDLLTVGRLGQHRGRHAHGHGLFLGKRLRERRVRYQSQREARQHSDPGVIHQVRLYTNGPGDFR